MSCQREIPAESVNAAIRLALGRIFRLLAYPATVGDIAQYEQCRKLILDLCDDPPEDKTPNYARDRNKGSAGD